MTEPLEPQKLLASIEIYEQETILTQVDEDGAERRFVVAPEQLQRLLKLPVAPVLLRPEPGLLAVAATADIETHLFALAAKSWSVTVQGQQGKRTTSLKVALPAFVLSVRVWRESRRIVGITALTFAGRTVRPDTLLHEMPLPNFNGRGEMCLGTVEVICREGKSVREAGLKAIFGSAFNNHHGTVGKKGEGFAAFVERNKGRAPLGQLAEVGPAKRLLPELFSSSCTV